MRNPDLEIRRSYDQLDGWVQDCSRSFANAMELLQSCTKPSILSSQCDFHLLLRYLHIESGPWMWCSNVVIDILYWYITEEHGKMWYMSLSISEHSTYIMFRNHDMSRCVMQDVNQADNWCSQDQGFASVFKEFYFCDMYICTILYNTSKLHKYCTELSQLYWVSCISEHALHLAW